uniref:Uncharacterized protein n=1 Tax=Homo sapiens TaxID=9606 RepID=Q14801_HUMAN|nr:unknown [Homo sapiens]
MYIKTALPCLPFFVVSSINLLSRPERGWEGNATVKGVGRIKLLHSPKQKRRAFSKNIKFTCSLRDYLDKVQVRSF